MLEALEDALARHAIAWKAPESMLLKALRPIPQPDFGRGCLQMLLALFWE